MRLLALVDVGIRCLLLCVQQWGCSSCMPAQSGLRDANACMCWCELSTLTDNDWHVMGLIDRSGLLCSHSTACKAALLTALADGANADGCCSPGQPIHDVALSRLHPPVYASYVVTANLVPALTAL
jgi:hypothetical protein